MTSNLKLPLLLAGFITSQNNHDSTSFSNLFTADAQVKDEGMEYEGRDKIKAWNEMTNKKYQTHMEALHYEVDNGIDILTILMSGTFPGSPVEARFYFEIKNDGIQSLTIQ